MFRVTQQFAAASSREHIARQSSELFRVQQQISTGLRIQRPADDPTGTRRSLIQKDRLERLTAHTTSLQHVQSRVEQAHVQLREVSNLMQRAQTIALSAQQALDSTEVQALTAELNGILHALGSAANSMDESGYLFSGTAALTKPFPGTVGESGISSYAGTSVPTQLKLTGEIPRDALLPGDLVFQPLNRGPSLLIGQTGATIGSGTDTANGTRQLRVTHTSTTYSMGSGVAPGANSVTADTVLGAVGTHQLEIIDTSGTGAFGTVSLNGGAPVAFSNTQLDLMVIGPQGEQVSLNTTGIVAGFSGTVDITAEGTVSLDGGLTEVVVEFSSDQMITDSRDGTVVFVNTAGITRTGLDQLEFPGTTDVFAAVAALRDDLLNTRGLSPSDRTAAINRRVGDLERIHNHLLEVLGVQSVSMEQMDRLTSRTEDLALAEKLELNNTVAADITEAVLRLQELQNLQQFTLATAARVLTPNLLNYLQ